MPYKNIEKRREYGRKRIRMLRKANPTYVLKERIWMRLWRKRNKKKIEVYRKNYYKSHKKMAYIYLKAWAKKNPEKIHAYSKISRERRRLLYPEKVKAYNKLYRERNIEKIRIRDKNYYLLNQKKIHKKRKIYIHHNRKLINAQYKKYRNNNINYKLAGLLRSRLLQAFKKGEYAGKKGGSAIRNLGCTIPELKVHLEKQFKEGMTWENLSFYGWHIDHKVPLSHFDLTNPDQVKIVCHYTNLQPMWSKENFSKGNRI